MNHEIDRQTLTAACSIVRTQTDKLAGHLRRLEKSDEIEEVHQARVACRRMRQAFTFFADCFEQELLVDWKKATKKLLRQLSLARDLDVQMIFLKEFIETSAAGDKKAGPGLARLLLRLQQHRHQIQSDVLKAAARFQRKKILINIHLQTEKILFQMRQSPPAAGDTLRQRIQERLGSVFEPMNKKESALADPKDSEGHHALRIAVKRFRYCLEIADSVMGGRLESFVKTAKTLQTLLGDLHDCILWQEYLDNFAEDEKDRMREFCGHIRGFGRLTAGIALLSRDRRHAAKEIYRQACECVDEINHRETWREVFDIISHQPLDKIYEQPD
jgi:CHAD domain-containing protein